MVINENNSSHQKLIFDAGYKTNCILTIDNAIITIVILTAMNSNKKY